MCHPLFSSPNGCEFYRHLRDSSDPIYAQRRAHIEELWQRFEPYAEKGFEGVFPQQLAQRYWEMFVGCSLLDCGFQLPLKPDPSGPDFKARLEDGRTLWVECVTFGSGNPSETEDARKLVPQIEDEHKTDDDGGYIAQQHLAQLALRVANAFSNKLNNIRQVGPEEFFVLAVGPGEVDPIVLHNNITSDLVSASLFAPFRDTNLIALVDGPILAHRATTTITAPVTKPFDMCGAEQVSGVLFSTRVIASNAHPWQDELIWIENYRAARRLDVGVFKGRLSAILMELQIRSLKAGSPA